MIWNQTKNLRVDERFFLSPTLFEISKWGKNDEQITKSEKTYESKVSRILDRSVSTTWHLLQVNLSRTWVW